MGVDAGAQLGATVGGDEGWSGAEGRGRPGGEGDGRGGNRGGRAAWRQWPIVATDGPRGGEGGVGGRFYFLLNLGYPIIMMAR